ncbi:succinate--CoA ligase [GDP-forming] subunit beta, mitochondrial [Agrilus planipennis]|uniref:Succinate--CoA ligase [GDP-forming] subunit beta, mitochondrial n=1 Tax=Agrilus planipennis TaxID=224129 RepID=A0A1W4XAU8_AGRPL|nr:succinate--CoA ligase [GDP-forming] subunit beta, mitochondrial [Agrilus planipennis]
MSSMWNSVRKLPLRTSILKVPVRYINLLEYQSKSLLKKHGVAIQDFCMVDDSGTNQLDNFNAKEYVIKAQILAGGRGKGHFDSGFKGGVHLTTDRNKIQEIARQMLGHKLITKQTPQDGILVRKVMVARSVNIKRETYVCILMDRMSNGPVLIASPAGGVDIEAVAEKTPHLIKKVPIDIYEGLTDSTAKEVAQFLEFKGNLQEKAADQLKKIWELFLKVDAIQVEINPFVETEEGEVISVDAKMNFDDNAAYRQKEIFAMHDTSEDDPREVEAAKYNLNYIGMTGNIGCLVNGAGLAMATMDIIKLYGGDPANFLDVGGSVKEDQVKAAFKILTSDENVKSILVNIFGGIVNCATIANGIVGASKSINFDIPLIVRLEGTNVNEAKKIIKECGLAIQSADDLDDAAQKAVKSIDKAQKVTA